MIAVETGHGAVRLVDPNTGREFVRLEDPNQDIVWPLFSPDGTQLVTTSHSNTNSIHIWNLRAIRSQLADMGLDWDLPAYPPSDKPTVGNALRGAASGGVPPHRASPLTVAVDLAELAGAKQANAHDKQGQAAVGLQQWDKAIAEYTRALDLSPNHAQSHNNLAWLLATCSDAKFRVPTAAVEHARRAVELDSNAAHFWNTLGTAHYRAGNYRAGNWRAAIGSLEKAEQLSPDKHFGANTFFLALAHWQLDEKQPARKWFDQASEWMEKNQPQDDELQRFRAEAAELLGPKENAEK